jgi:hypothetical protein
MIQRQPVERLAGLQCSSSFVLPTEPADYGGSSCVLILSAQARLGLASDHY